MNTQSHAIITYYLIRRGLEKRPPLPEVLNPILFGGALLPDVPLYIFFGWYTFLNPTSQKVIWEELYFRPDWQMVFDFSHSLPFWGLAALVLWRSGLLRGAILALAAFLAAVQDFLFHHDDAHAHFFPLSDYRFRSPVSYWDPAHYGGYFSVLEIILTTAAGVWAFRRLESRWGKTILILSLVALAANYGLWSIIFNLDI